MLRDAVFAGFAGLLVGGAAAWTHARLLAHKRMISLQWGWWTTPAFRPAVADGLVTGSVVTAVLAVLLWMVHA
jgi:hypothetical protein